MTLKHQYGMYAVFTADGMTNVITFAQQEVMLYATLSDARAEGERLLKKEETDKVTICKVSLIPEEQNGWAPVPTIVTHRAAEK